MQSFIRVTTVVVAQGTMAVALLAGCDGGDRVEATKPAAQQRSAADAHEWAAHLQGQARTHLTTRLDPFDPARVGAIEQVERAARLDGQARTHRRAGADGDAPAPVDPTSTEEFVPGSRRLPMR
jgi:hypothetical protein